MSNMSTEDYSDLEVLHYDYQANAPPSNPARYRLELDKATVAPQVKKDAKSPDPKLS